ncbi:cupin domain-containing protein [Acidihalobacter ferrooxydans]|uniref:Cupin n=1 Tax=Acidihalobacter ferrooxydans TaxID=1765967 RepID=A0A1P8UEW6_9GAMM|nr:cupin domain-containing protein [Acidihalobacter ferrooxydans]APZ42397.1 cupin [Acidihalobacter ferrooxydans]
MPPNAYSLLGGLTPAEFLRDYWQRKPLLIRQAMPGLTSPLEPDELAGLALEDAIPSRLVIEHGTTPWAVRYGPFTEDDFAKLPETHWSLLVTDLEKFVPELGTLIDPFRFIPDWRIDDLMISYAPPQGSVGPHTDAYDVFLLQLQGHRRWQIDTRPVAADNRLPDTALHILRDFTPEQTWVLEPGDMLYLPPHIAHHGVALDDCMTASIGFRAPSQQELLGAWLDDAVARLDPALRYADPGLMPQTNPGEIDATARARAVALLRNALTVDDAALERWFAGYVTEPRADLASLYPEPPDWQADDLLAHLRAGAALHRNPAARLAWFAETDTVRCFADGEMRTLPACNRPLIEYLCRERDYRAGQILNRLDEPATALLLWLLQRGILEAHIPDTDTINTGIDA